MDDDIRLLLDALAGEMSDPKHDPRGTVAILIHETVRFRDKLKAEIGQILTVEDTRLAVEALQQYLQDKTFPADLTPVQHQLAQIYVDRLTVFGE